jgi:membrane-bound lytic murein transglycosylase MltF
MYDPRLQLRALLLMDRDGYRVASFARDRRERAAMAFVVYNSGKAGLVQDRQLCREVPGCDPSRWFGHIEKNSLKARTRAAGYGKSFFEISREYPKNVIDVRAPRYLEASNAHR